MAESTLVFGNKVIWQNPAALGHFGIKLRKQIRENEIADRCEAPSDSATGETDG